MKDLFTVIAAVIAVIIYGLFNIFLYGAMIAFSLWFFSKVFNWLF